MLFKSVESQRSLLLALSENMICVFRDGAAVTESSKYSFEVEGASKTIVIKAASIEDVGKYTCLAENVRTETELELKGAEETIEVVSEELQKEEVAIKGQEMTYTINFKKSYLEKPKVQWLFKSKTIITSERVITLKIFFCSNLQNTVLQRYFRT